MASQIVCNLQFVFYQIYDKIIALYNSVHPTGGKWENDTFSGASPMGRTFFITAKKLYNAGIGGDFCEISGLRWRNRIAK